MTFRLTMTKIQHLRAPFFFAISHRLTLIAGSWRLSQKVGRSETIFKRRWHISQLRQNWKTQDLRRKKQGPGFDFPI